MFIAFTFRPTCYFQHCVNYFSRTPAPRKLSGVLAPILVIYIIFNGNNRKIMKKNRLGLITNIGLVMTALMMITAAILLFYGLATGQTG